MSFRGSRIACLPVVVGLALAIVLPARAQEAQRRGSRAIQFSEPRSDVVASNLNQISSQKQTLTTLENQLKQPFELFSPPSDSLSGILTPSIQRPLPTPAKSKRMKEQLEKRDEWIYLGPEDYEPGLTAEDMLHVPQYGPDGELKKPRTALERYYDRMDKARAAATNQAGGLGSIRLGDKELGREESKDSLFGGEKSALSSGMSAMEQALKRLSNDNADDAATPENSAPKSFSEFFGFGKAQTPEQIQEAARAHQAHLEEFKQLLEIRSTPTPNPGGSSVNLLTGPPTPVAPLAAPGVLDAFPNPATRGVVSPPAPSPSSLSPSLGLPGLSGVSPPPGTPGWQAPPPVPSLQRPTFQPSTFSLPQRKF